MSVAYRKFELPNKIVVDSSSDDLSTFASFTLEPLEKGFGNTIGNSLRRALLSSIEAPAIIGVKMSGVTHEMQTLEGITEDMTDVVLNFKEARLKLADITHGSAPHKPELFSFSVEITEEMLSAGGGKHYLTFGEIFKASNFQVVNPLHRICTVNKAQKIDFSIRVGQGRGYLFAEDNQLDDRVDDEIIIDAIFSPIKLVNYTVEPVRVREGKTYDHEKLVISVTTDGRIKPDESMALSAKILMNHLKLCDLGNFVIKTVDDEPTHDSSDGSDFINKVAERVSEIELTVRSYNCLVGANIETLAELITKNESEMLKYRNFGRKSLDEIKGVLEEKGLSLGMQLPEGYTADSLIAAAQVQIAKKDEKAKQEGVPGNPVTSEEGNYET